MLIELCSSCSTLSQHATRPRAIMSRSKHGTPHERAACAATIGSATGSNGNGREAGGRGGAAPGLVRARLGER